ncbi:hypothetical protein SDC9_188487 [bioreactor metagenome]|uniref:Uncharacterized protein n=1 Tax=bioreactor metagenome TaxID=1076179 RepID=A0A645HPQ7_9ZZZZ
MADKIRFVGRDIFHTHNIPFRHLYNFIHHQERITVRQQLTDTIVIHHWFFIYIIYRRLHLVHLDIFTDQSCQFIIDLMPGTRSNEPSFDRFTDKRHITYNIEQFMTCRFIGEHQLTIIQIA